MNGVRSHVSPIDARIKCSIFMTANTWTFRKYTWTIHGYQLRNLQNAASMSPLRISFINKDNELANLHNIVTKLM